MNINMKLATIDFTEICYAFIEEARLFQQSQGFVQWTSEYPNLQTVKQDIKAKKGYILLVDNSPFGYLCLDFDGEVAYENIKGKWHSSNPYAVIHRLAFTDTARSCGYAKHVFKLINNTCLSKNITSIRIDTDSNNECMKHLLIQTGYIYCGTIIFQQSKKLAYDLLLTN